MNKIGFARQAVDQVVVIGASTGGPNALETLLRTFDAATPPVVIVQHMPENFTRALARRLDEILPVTVHEAEQGMRLLKGHVYIGPGGRHIRIRRMGLGLAVELGDEPLQSRHRPSADVLFHSVARVTPGSALGVLLTGMGDDGARGLLAMREAGYRTLVQNQATSVVWGMPQAAYKLGAVADEDVLSLEEIGRAIRDFAAHIE